MKKVSGWKTKGMNRDLSVSAFSPEFAFENMNLRLSTNEGNTTLSWVNEKGTAQIAMMNAKEGRGASMVPATINGVCIGTAVLNKYLVLFVTDRPSDDEPDGIYRLEYTGEKRMSITPLYEGNLGFAKDKPIETLVSYEAEDIQKVYWTDGKNQPRLINIAPITDSEGNQTEKEYSTPTAFDFIPTLQLNETVKVKKIHGGGGMFAPGVIQYAFTYYYKHGQESNIFYTTPLLYISHIDRGASPEDKVDNLFKISIDEIDTNFDYLRIYSIQRTSINATPICKRVQDISLEGKPEDGGKITSASFIDNGTMGNSVDPSELLFKGGNPTYVGTIEQKDNTLFMGDLSVLNNMNLQEVYDGYLKENKDNPISLKPSTRTFYPTEISTGDYPYANQLTSFDDAALRDNVVPCSGFKYGDKYRCGLQFQDKFGRWTTPIFLEDVPVVNQDDEDIHPSTNGGDKMPDFPDLHPDDGQPLLINLSIQNATDKAMIISSLVEFAIWDNINKVAIPLEGYIFTDGTITTIGAGETQVFNDVQVYLGKRYEGKEFAELHRASAIGFTNTMVLHDTWGRAEDSNGHAVFELNNGHAALAGTLLSNETYEIRCTNVIETTEPEHPTGTGIKFIIKNPLSVEARFSGQVVLNVSKSPTDWANSTQVYAHMHAAVDGHFPYNDIIIPAGGIYTSPDITTITGIYMPSTNFMDGTWYIMNRDHPTNQYQHAVKLYTRIYSYSRQETSNSDDMYVVAPRSNRRLYEGASFEFTLSYKNSGASLAPDTSGPKYVILAEGQQGL